MSSVRQSGRRRRRDTKSDRLPHLTRPLGAALQTKIGRELQACFQPPKGLPHQLLVLLIQLNQ
jgi:hypothetical protein